MLLCINAFNVGDRRCDIGIDIDIGIDDTVVMDTDTETKPSLTPRSRC